MKTKLNQHKEDMKRDASKKVCLRPFELKRAIPEDYFPKISSHLGYIQLGFTSLSLYVWPCFF